MTEQELASAIFSERTGSNTAQSMLTGLALAASADDEVLVRIDGTQRGASGEQGVYLPTTANVAKGDRVIITLYGPDGRGKKGYVSGIVGGESGGGSGLETRVQALEDRATTDETKINEIISVVNDMRWERLYRFSPSASHVATLWYQRATGLVYVGININGNLGSGWTWFNSGAAIPSALRPAGAPGNAALHDARNVIWTSPAIMVCSGSDGYLSTYTQNSGTSNEAGSVLYLVQPNLNYSYTIWSGPDITPLTMSRALAARVVLGDGLDVTTDELKQDADVYDEAYEIIFER